MARTRKDIKNDMTSSFISNDYIRTAYGLVEGKSFEEQFSIVSFENILFDIVSYFVFLLEQLFDTHKSELDQQLYNQKSGRLPWYRYMALKFQYGFDLLTDSDEFDNLEATAEQIEASKIIKYAAVNEGDVQGVIIVKIAGETNGELAPISSEAQESVEAYFDEVRYAGSRVRVINYLPDQLTINIKVFRDPLVIDANGVNIITGEKPVENALNEYMRELPFNGELVLESLVDKLQKVDGVLIPHLEAAYSAWVDPETGNYGVPTLIDVKRVPESGYFKILNFDGISYVV